MNIKNGILNMPKHGNKQDLIHFVTNCNISFDVKTAFVHAKITEIYLSQSFHAILEFATIFFTYR